MSSYEVREVGARAGERGGGRVNGAGLASGSVAVSGGIEKKYMTTLLKISCILDQDLNPSL